MCNIPYGNHVVHLRELRRRLRAAVAAGAIAPSAAALWERRFDKAIDAARRRRRRKGKGDRASQIAAVEFGRSRRRHGDVSALLGLVKRKAPA